MQLLLKCCFNDAIIVSFNLSLLSSAAASALMVIYLSKYSECLEWLQQEDSMVFYLINWTNLTAWRRWWTEYVKYAKCNCSYIFHPSKDIVYTTLCFLSAIIFPDTFCISQNESIWRFKIKNVILVVPSQREGNERISIKLFSKCCPMRPSKYTFTPFTLPFIWTLSYSWCKLVKN